MNQVKNNKGLSLIEIIVAMAIVAILFLGVASFMQSSTTYYGRTKKETKLKNESQMVFRTVSDCNRPERNLYALLRAAPKR